MLSEQSQPEDLVPAEGDTPQLWQAYRYDSKNNRSAGIYIGIVHGTREMCIEWLEATTPGFVEELDMGQARLSHMTIWYITPEKIVEDRAAHKARIDKGQK